MSLSKGIVKEQEKKIAQLEEERDELAGSVDFWKKEDSISTKYSDELLRKCNELAEKLQAYEANENPNMAYHMQKEINELHQCLRDADKERDEAKEQAEQAMDDFKKLHKEYKEYEIEYEARYKNMKAQRDHYAAVAQLQLEVSE